MTEAVKQLSTAIDKTLIKGQSILHQQPFSSVEFLNVFIWQDYYLKSLHLINPILSKKYCMVTYITPKK